MNLYNVILKQNIADANSLYLEILDSSPLLVQIQLMIPKICLKAAGLSIITHHKTSIIHFILINTYKLITTNST